MKPARLLLTTALLTAFSSFALADSAKPLALSPAPHPGKEARHASFNEQYWAPMGAANFGIGGDRTEHILWRLANGNYDGLKPKLTVLLIGTNNTGHQGRPMAEHGGAVYGSTAEETAAGITEIVKVLKEKQPQMKILLLAIFPRGATPEDKMRQQNEATNQLIAKLDDGKTVFFMDINQDFLEADGTLSKEVMPDLLHPNEKGYEIWSKAIEARVKGLMAE